MTRAHVLIVGGVPHLHITRPGAPAETRPMDQRELVRLMEEVARAVLVGASLQKLHEMWRARAGHGFDQSTGILLGSIPLGGDSV